MLARDGGSEVNGSGVNFRTARGCALAPRPKRDDVEIRLVNISGFALVVALHVGGRCVKGGLLYGLTHNPNDHPEDDAITSTDGVSNTPPKGVVGEMAVDGRATVKEPDALADVYTTQGHR